MSQKEKQERIDYLERELFLLEMKDRWDDTDAFNANEMKKELKELKQDEQLF